ncbi:MAG: DUF4157 domain-containing protein [Anaerolineales bacterium]|nr:DUF4157 domain-containing protein [Anaerolineales bacterium]
MPARRLSEVERAEARLVFGDGLDYDHVRIVEGGYFPPNFIADIGAFLQGKKRTWDNAITLGNTTYFPRFLRTTAEDIAQDLTDIGWLMHELTHVWQYQQVGWRYLYETLRVQVRLGWAAYDYVSGHRSKQQALRMAFAKNRCFEDFNFEQQGEFARDYYYALKRNEEPEAWGPYVQPFRLRKRRRNTVV